jgi:hypothetical protein
MDVNGEVNRLQLALANGPLRRMEQDRRLGRNAERSDVLQARRYVGLIWHLTGTTIPA